MSDAKQDTRLDQRMDTRSGTRQERCRRRLLARGCSDFEATLFSVLINEVAEGGGDVDSGGGPEIDPDGGETIERLAA